MTSNNVHPLNPDHNPYRQVPSNIEVEQALLGAILVNNTAFDRVSDFLQSDHFFEQVHKIIFKVMAEMIPDGRKVDPITVQTYLPADAKIADLTLGQYMARLAGAAVTIVNAADYGRTIFDLYQRRQLINISEDVAARAYDTKYEDPATDQIESAELRLFNLAEFGNPDRGLADLAQALHQNIDSISKAYQRDGGLSGVSTGLKRLDEHLGGLQKSDLFIIAGRPGMGKTALATSIAYHVANSFVAGTDAQGQPIAEQGGRVAFFSLEMSAEQLAQRIISDQTDLTVSKMRRGEITEDDFEKIAAVSNEKSKIPLYIDETAGLSIAQLSTRARRMKRQNGVDLIVVDYLQLMQGHKKTNENRVQEMTEITVGLKRIAKELNVPVIALSQLSRQVESREDKRPLLSDLRESGSIEQDADVVLFVYREEYYLLAKQPDEKDSRHVEWLDRFDQVKGKAEAIIAKQRHGPTGKVHLAFQASYTRFSDLVEDDHLPDRHD